MAVSLSDLARLHWARGDDAQAASYLERALAVREAHIDLILAADSARGRRLFLEQFMSDLDATITFALERLSVQTRRLAMTTLLARKGRVLDATSGAFAAAARQPIPPRGPRGGAYNLVGPSAEAPGAGSWLLILLVVLAACRLRRRSAHAHSCMPPSG